jgi:ribonuclease R
MKRLTVLRDLRAEIIEILSATTTPLPLLELSKRLRVRSGSEDYEHMRDLLSIMTEEGTIIAHSRRRFSMTTMQSDGIRGVLSIYHENATVRTKDAELPIIHVRRQHMHTALDGDTVLVKPHAIPKDRKVRGEVVAVVERAEHVIAGTLDYDGAFYYLLPDEAKYHVDFLVSEKNVNGAKPGDKILASFVKWEHANAAPEATVTEIVGRSGKAVVEFAAVRKEFRLPEYFPDVVEQEASIAEEPTNIAPEGRRDCTKDLIITIDPVNARDFDDALSLVRQDDGSVELGVHIADVSHYVREGTALDAESQKRGNSTYLVDGVVPMLPEHLSNNVCSLVPNRPRFAFSVFMVFSPNGTRTSYRIEETLIESKRRFTYEEAQAIIDTGEGDHVDLIHALHQLSRKLYTNRMKTGGIDFETQETSFILDDAMMPVSAVVKTRTHATSLVEECMLAANRCVAEHLHALKKAWRTKELPPYIYRVHDKPDREKLSTALGVVRALGVSVPSGTITPAHINAILQQAADRVEKPVINTLLLRSMSKAIYGDFNIGHYGLGFTDYAHFTSPIRRYPDLFVHRVLKEYAIGKPSNDRWKLLQRVAGAVGDQCSATERTSVEAERASNKCAQTILAREHIGIDYVGYITGVAQFGVFVTVENLSIEGLLHIRDLSDDYYIFDERRMRLVGRSTRRVFRFGARVRVRIVRADIKKRMIDLELSQDQTGVDVIIDVTPNDATSTYGRGVKRRSRES